MRIGIDARMLGEGFGIARYVQQLVNQLDTLKTGHTFVLFLRKENWEAFTPVSDQFEKVCADIPWYTLEEQTKLSRIIESANIHFMHFPHWNIPVTYNKPFVVTMHDLTMYHFARPEATTLGPLKFWIKDKAHRLVVNHAVKKSAHILTTTEFTKADIHETLGVPREKMTVTYQAPFQGRVSAHPEKTQKKYGIEKPYVLYVGAAYPHKNVNTLLAAWDIFEKDCADLNYQLVLVGKETSFYTQLMRDGDGLHHATRTHYTGFVPDADLPDIYAGAKLFVFPSLYEGFGIPPLEAMHAGVPVVSSNRSCMPEVLQDGVLYADPEDVQALYGAIHLGLTNSDIRSELRVNAKRVVKQYSWKKLAEETLAVYNKEL